MKTALNQLENALNQVIVGKPNEVRLALTCLLARGHLLLEDLPGAGKTTLAKTLALLLGLDNQRIQFTADMLPADITGAMIYQPGTQSFSLQKGPIFTNVLLADEINRASPKCQSALLEAMEENQVSIEGQTLLLDAPFFVIATQNPIEQYGTYPLPESQLDRFLFRLSLGYLDEATEIAVLVGEKRRDMLKNLTPVIDKNTLLDYQAAVDNVAISVPIAGYIRDLLAESRNSGVFLHGLSTRAGMALVQAAKAYAFLDGKQHVLPEHVQRVFPFVAMHRLTPKGRLNDGSSAQTQAALVHDLLETVAIKR